MAATHASSPRAQAALNRLCQAYWYPLYAFIRRKGYGPADAEDLTQGFFLHLLERNTFARADREKGRLRSFLLGALKKYLVNEWRKGVAQVRGGGKKLIWIDGLKAEERYRWEPVDPDNPEKLYDRRWALTIIEGALLQLEAQFARDAKQEQFALLKPYLVDSQDLLKYAQVAQQLGKSEDAVKMTIARLRKRFRELLRQEIAHTVLDPLEVENEIRTLFAALGG